MEDSRLTRQPWRKPWRTLLPRRTTIAFQILLFALLTLGITVEVGSLISTQFWVGYAVWAVIGFSLFPLRVAIPNRRKAIGPFVGEYALIMFMFLVYLIFSVTGREHSPLVFLVGSFPGALLGVTINLFVASLPFRKVAVCQTCRVERGLAKDRSDWYCTTCGTLVRTLT